jgi:hypothetical protein
MLPVVVALSSIGLWGAFDLWADRERKVTPWGHTARHRCGGGWEQHVPGHRDIAKQRRRAKLQRRSNQSRRQAR